MGLSECAALLFAFRMFVATRCHCLGQIPAHLGVITSFHQLVVRGWSNGQAN
jgi:hypothetical protein